jgi:hypothetical protein
MTQINGIDEEKYHQLQSNALRWVKENSTLERAKEILKLLNS